LGFLTVVNLLTVVTLLAQCAADPTTSSNPIFKAVLEPLTDKVLSQLRSVADLKTALLLAAHFRTLFRTATNSRH
jgi:hypothetical protein